MLSLEDYGDFQDFLDALALQGGTGLVPRSTYTVNGRYGATFTKPTRIVGEGPGISVLKWVEPGGLAISYTDPFYPPAIEGLSFCTTATSGTGLALAGPTWPFGAVPGPVLRDLEFRGDVVADQCWSIGLSGVGLWNPLIQNIYAKGKKDNRWPPFTMQSGISLTNCMAPVVRDVYVYHATNGVLISGGEGLVMTPREIVGCELGIVLTNASGYAPGTSITGGHVNCFSRSIKLAGRSQVNVSGVLCYKTVIPSMPPVYWQGVEVVNSESIVVSGCQCRAPGATAASGGQDGMSVVASYGCVLSGNVVDDFPNGSAAVLLAAGSDRNMILDTRCGLNVSGVSGAVMGNVIR